MSTTTTTTTTATADRPRARSARGPQSGPPLLAPVLAYAALTVIGVIVNRSTPHPDASGAAVLAYTAAHSSMVKAGAWLLFATATPLALTAAVVYRRLRALGITAPGSAIAWSGGALAASALALSGIFAWTGGRLPADASPALARALADVSFLTGGPAFATMFALLIAGIAVPSWLAGLLPRPLAFAGLALAIAGVLSTLTLLSLGFGFLLPIIRFGGTAWLIAAAAMLPRTRHARAV
ncbi:hypothetical protein ABH935_009928 [Catenulispora sp. GAS73]|uniref:DUF4386 domain-containing protein n=1 Tax=Catenulispora sp. GAS73 TaxID=3156269 RepID=UPI0035158CD4